MPGVKKYNSSYATKRVYKKKPSVRKPARKVVKKAAKPAMKGLGAYKLFNKNKRVAKSFRNVGADIGAFASNRLGLDPKYGHKAGKYLGKQLSKVIGFGDYAISNEQGIKTNSLFSGAASPPSVINTPSGCIVRHREYIKDISSSIGFTLQSFDINPGLNRTFPWLYNIATNFENYRFRGLAFEFKSTSANALNSTNTALGTVILAAQYNAAAPDFVSKQQMENYEGAISCKPSESALCGIECARRELVLEKLYVRNNPVPDDQDQRLYDLGSFEIATQGSQAAAQVGELWVTYEVELFHPKMYGGLFGGDVLSAHYTFGGTISTSAYFGSTQTADENNTISCTFTTNAIVLDPSLTAGQFMIVYRVLGSSTAALVRPNVADNTNVTGVNCFVGGVNVTGPSADTSTTLTMVHTFDIDGEPQGGGAIALSGGTLPTSITAGELWIVQMNPLIVA